MCEALSAVFAAFEVPFRELATELARQHPEARFQVRSDSAGTATTGQGHTLYVECFWPGRDTDEPDNVSLEVELCHLTTAPRINADVCWGEGPFEAEFASEWQSSDDWPEATPSVLGDLSARMPDLMAAFRRAVARGWPAEQGTPNRSMASAVRRRTISVEGSLSRFVSPNLVGIGVHRQLARTSERYPILTPLILNSSSDVSVSSLASGPTPFQCAHPSRPPSAS